MGRRGNRCSLNIDGVERWGKERCGSVGEITYICCVLKISWWERRGAHGVGVGRDGAEGSCVGFGGGQKTKWRLCSRVTNSCLLCLDLNGFMCMGSMECEVVGEFRGLGSCEAGITLLKSLGHWEVQRRVSVDDAGGSGLFLDS